MGMLLLGKVIDADEAERIGLVHEVVDGAELAAHTAELAERLAQGPTLAFAAVKEAVWFASSAPIGDVLLLEAQLQKRLATSEDHRAAVQAFLEKRQPAFSGS